MMHSFHMHRNCQYRQTSICSQSLLSFTTGTAIGKIIYVCQMSRMLRRINAHHSEHQLRKTIHDYYSQRQVTIECKQAKAGIGELKAISPNNMSICRLTGVSISFAFVWLNSGAFVPLKCRWSIFCFLLRANDFVPFCVLRHGNERSKRSKRATQKKQRFNGECDDRQEISEEENQAQNVKDYWIKSHIYDQIIISSPINIITTTQYNS